VAGFSAGDMGGVGSRVKKMWQAEEFQLLLVGFVAMLLTLSVSSTINDLSALPLLLPLSLLGTWMGLNIWSCA